MIVLYVTNNIFHSEGEGGPDENDGENISRPDVFVPELCARLRRLKAFARLSLALC